MHALFSRAIAAAVIAAAVFAAADAARAETVTVIHRFAGGKDGANPHAGLAYVGGHLYGTTTAGGGGTGCSNGDMGCGTAFEMTLDGDETARHEFAGSPDGAFPYGDLLDVAGALYGTTFAGGEGCQPQGCGMVFKLKLPEAIVVHRFKGSPNDGANPVAGLTCMTSDATCAADDALYGATSNGGKNNVGMVFKVGADKPVYSFEAAGSGDGASPYGSLLNLGGSGGSLYGTTMFGGVYTNCPPGCGTLFKVTPEGFEEPYHRFQGKSGDGAAPFGGLIYVALTDYGTTTNGGEGCLPQGCGTVFKNGPEGYHVVHFFKGGSDGALPLAGLLNAKGTLYGTTEFGGGKGSCLFGGCGTLIRVTLTGVEVFYSFPGGAEGARPAGKLINVGGVLYGTTYAGGGTGCGGDGCGTVFKVTSP
jgi:uncharacterized repeat protein (TIGR03803 family)